MRAACALQLSSTSNLDVLRLLTAADHRGRPHTAAGDSEDSQEQSRALRSPTTRCTARPRLLQMAALERFQHGLTAIPDDQLLVLSGPSVSAAERALRSTEWDRGNRCLMRLCKSDNF